MQQKESSLLHISPQEGEGLGESEIILKMYSTMFKQKWEYITQKQEVFWTAARLLILRFFPHYTVWNVFILYL